MFQFPTRIRFASLALISCIIFMPAALARADEPEDPRIWHLAGTWTITFAGGPALTYTIEPDGKTKVTADGVNLTGQLELKDGKVLLAFSENKKLEQLSLWTDGRLYIEQWNAAGDFPKKKAAQTGTAVRQSRLPSWVCPPGVQIRDMAGHWAMAYFNNTSHFYTFDKEGKLHGKVGDRDITGQLEMKDGRILLTHNDYDWLERFSPRIDGRLVSEFWDHKADFPAKKANQIGMAAPVSGKDTACSEVIDPIVLAYLEKIGCSGAALTIERNGHMYYSRGYGWIDPDHRTPIEFDTPMCTASCDKPLTASMIHQLADQGKLDLNASVLKVLDIKPAGKIVDTRVWDITIQNLLEHKAGWQGAPVAKAWQEANGSKFPIEAETLLSYVMCQRLAWKPGSKAEYDSFGYNSLKRVVAKVSGQTYIDYLQTQLCRPYGIQELKWVRHGTRQKGEPPRLWNGYIMEDPEEYRMDVSMPALCTVMRHFWVDGTPREKSNGLYWVMGGGWDNATTTMAWRSDHIDVAWSFNGRADGGDPGEPLWKDAVDRLVAEKRIPGK